MRRAQAEIEREKECTALAVTQAEKLIQQRNAALARLAEVEGYKDGAYTERNKLVALLSKLFPSGTKRTAIEGWSEDWHGCVYIDLPTGQASWHYHDSQAHLFAHLPPYAGTWDGHTTEQKYERIAGYAAAGASPQQSPLAFKPWSKQAEMLESWTAGASPVQPSQAGDAQDAARYRWLRPALTRGGNVEDSGELVVAFSHLAHTPTEPEFDAAIDAAINAKETDRG